MKGLTLTQPWATLIAIGAKTVETRSRQTHYRGPIAIHAAKGLNGLGKGAGEWDLWMYCQGREAIRDALVAAGYARPGHPADDPVVETATLPRGALVAVARLAACVPTTQFLAGGGTQHRPTEIEFGDYSPGRWAWVLTNVVALPEPVPFRGNQTLFNIPSALALPLASWEQSAR